MEKVIEELISNKDLKYRKFTSKLIPNIDISTIIGVRAPIIRKMAKKINNTEDRNIFIKSLPHKYHEENILHGYLISLNKDVNATLNELDNFLPFVNNWAVSDTISPKIFSENLDNVYNHLIEFLKSNEEYKVRFAIVSFLQFYLNDSKYVDSINKLLMKYNSESYYINMAIAWYFSTALIKQYEKTIDIFEDKKIKNKWVYNKSIQKAIESFRVSSDKKDYLKSLKSN